MDLWGIRDAGSGVLDGGTGPFLKFADGERVVLPGVDDAATWLDQIDFT